MCIRDSYYTEQMEKLHQKQAEDVMQGGAVPEDVYKRQDLPKLIGFLKQKKTKTLYLYFLPFFHIAPDLSLIHIFHFRYVIVSITVLFLRA